jgi:hypothetical protein
LLAGVPVVPLAVVGDDVWRLVDACLPVVTAVGMVVCLVVIQTQLKAAIAKAESDAAETSKKLAMLQVGQSFGWQSVTCVVLPVWPLEVLWVLPVLLYSTSFCASARAPCTVRRRSQVRVSRPWKAVCPPST